LHRGNGPRSGDSDPNIGIPLGTRASFGNTADLAMNGCMIGFDSPRPDRLGGGLRDIFGRLRHLSRLRSTGLALGRRYLGVAFRGGTCFGRRRRFCDNPLWGRHHGVCGRRSCPDFRRCDHWLSGGNCRQSMRRHQWRSARGRDEGRCCLWCQSFRGIRDNRLSSRDTRDQIGKSKPKRDITCDIPPLRRLPPLGPVRWRPRKDGAPQTSPVPQ